MGRRDARLAPPTVVWRDTGTGIIPELVVPSADGHGWHKEPEATSPRSGEMGRSETLRRLSEQIEDTLRLVDAKTAEIDAHTRQIQDRARQGKTTAEDILTLREQRGAISDRAYREYLGFNDGGPLRRCRYCRHETAGKRCDTCGGPE